MIWIILDYKKVICNQWSGLVGVTSSGWVSWYGTLPYLFSSGRRDALGGLAYVEREPRGRRLCMLKISRAYLKCCLPSTRISQSPSTLQPENERPEGGEDVDQVHCQETIRPLQCRVLVSCTSHFAGPGWAPFTCWKRRPESTNQKADGLRWRLGHLSFSRWGRSRAETTKKCRAYVWCGCPCHINSGCPTRRCGRLVRVSS